MGGGRGRCQGRYMGFDFITGYIVREGSNLRKDNEYPSDM